MSFANLRNCFIVKTIIFGNWYNAIKFAIS